jgi:hypothetical protein
MNFEHTVIHEANLVLGDLAVELAALLIATELLK